MVIRFGKIIHTAYILADIYRLRELYSDRQMGLKPNLLITAVQTTFQVLNKYFQENKMFKRRKSLAFCQPFFI